MLAAPLPVLAHADIHERIAALDAQIEAHPNAPELYLKRGELHRLHRDWEAALADYHRAAELDPGLPEVDYFVGRMWLEAARPDLAKSALNRYLTRRPDDAGALVIRSRALARLGEGLAAAEDLTKAIARLEALGPELYLERSRLLVAEGGKHVDEGLRGIDEGIARLGPLVTLIQFAVEVEADRAHHEEALARLDPLPPGVRKQPLWLARRGDLLLAAGRDAEARAAYAAALQAIEALPATRRTVRANAALESRLRSLIEANYLWSK